MGIEDFKRWHWVLLGAVVGLVMAYAWASVGSDVEGASGRDEAAFERDILMKDEASGLPFVTGVVIHPTEESFKDGTGKPQMVNVVSYKRLARDKNGRIGWLNKKFVARVPYVPRIDGQVPATPDLTIQKYLTAMSRNYETVRFRYGWWLEPKKAMMLGTVAGVVLIGGIWPSLLGVMIGAGFGRKHDPEQEALTARQKKDGGFDWGSLLRRSKEAGQDGHGRPHATAADQREMDALTAAYEKNLGRGAHAGVGAAEGVAAEGAIRKLEGGPLEEAKPIAQPGDDDEIEVKGEYYPVLIHHKKHHDEKKPEQGAEQNKK